MKHLLFLLFSFSMTAQINGIVNDSLSGNPIPYVNIWVENENIGTNSEPDGTFSLDLKTEKNLIFSALGFETKIVKSTAIETVFLLPKMYELEEVVVERSKNRIRKKIGFGNKTGFKKSFQNVSQVYGKVFEVKKLCNKTPYLSTIEIFTKSKIDSARFRLRILDLDENGFPGNDLTQKEIIVFVKKGLRKTTINLRDYNIYLTDDAIFVGFQSLIINENKYRFDVSKDVSLRQKSFMHEPGLIINLKNEGIVFHSFREGIWSRVSKEVKGPSHNLDKIPVPAINIFLSN